MSKLYESIELTDELRRVTEESKQVMWLVLSETWCGDAAQLIPVFQAIAEYSEGIIDLRFLLRDQYPDLMDCHLTNGARSIPKIIVLDQGLNELTTWGPRPAPLQKLVMEWKAEAMPMEELVKKLMAWYEEDQTKTTQNELKNYIIEYSR